MAKDQRCGSHQALQAKWVWICELQKWVWICESGIPGKSKAVIPTIGAMIATGANGLRQIS
jgi:hypothetical protein